MKKKALSRWIIAGTLLAAGACSPVNDGALGATDNFSQSDRTLAFGFEVIKDRYLTDVTMADVAFGGMQGLSTVDPAVTVTRPDPQHIQLSYHDKALGNFAAPAADDADGWADLVAQLAQLASTQSPELRKAGVEGMRQAVFDTTLAKLDMFSRYANPNEAREHRAARNGFGGIGIRCEPKDDAFALTEVMPDTPAARANLHVGDRILAVDNHPVTGIGQDGIVNLLRGPVASSVSLKLQQAGTQEASVVSLRRSLIIPPTVTLTLKDGIATIAISSFNQGTAHYVEEAVRQAKASPGFKGIELDLRGNPGGLLDQGIMVADLFMDHGPIVTTKGRNAASLQSYDAKPGDIGEDVQLVVIVDGKSASAAEIVASALQDSGRAVVVGTNSYGKGTVQTVVRLPNEGEMTLTWSRYYSPAGYALHGLGVMPTICTANEKAEPAALLAPIRAGHSAVPVDISTWRATKVDDVEQRKQLRMACPAAKQGGLQLDAELGRALLTDPALYARALALTTPTATLSASAVPEVTTAH